MSIKDRFIENFGINDFFSETVKADEPIEYDIMGEFNHTCLTNIYKFDKIKKWKKFIPLPMKYIKVRDTWNEFVEIDDWYFAKYYIEKAITTMDPDEYAIFEQFNEREKENHKLLAFKKDKYIIIICPFVPDEDDKKEKVFLKMEDITKESPKSVFVL